MLIRILQQRLLAEAPRFGRRRCATRRGPAAAVLLSCSLLVGGSGCQSTKVADNPVVGPNPPRLSDEILAQLEKSDSENRFQRRASAEVGEGQGQIVQVSATQAVIRDEDIAARVNGRPIFVSEVLERYRGPLEAQRPRMTAQAYQAARRELIEKELEGYIEQALVLQAVRSKFKSEQWEELQAKLDEFFYESELPDLQERLNAGSAQAVEAQMQQAGTTLAAYRRVWGDRQLAAQWIREQIPEARVSRAELLQEYQNRIEEYREPEQVKWQQCWISNVGNGGRDGAQQRLQAAIDDLKQGLSFDEVVTRYSDGPLAKSGGHWDWANPESLAEDRLREALAKLEHNQIGPVLEDERGFRLIKLTGRRAAVTKPFEDVQAELREAILQRKREVAAKELIARLRREAHIETILDKVPSS